jgi:hypothetical protein
VINLIHPLDDECARYRRRIDPLLGRVEDLQGLDAGLLPEDCETLQEKGSVKNQ